MSLRNTLEQDYKRYKIISGGGINVEVYQGIF